MKKIWETICGYVWWTYKRGGFHYDVMVTVILLFIFVTPLEHIGRYPNPLHIDFHDKPTERILHLSRVVVSPDPNDEGVLVCQVDAKAIPGKDINAELLNVIEPIAGEVSIARYEAVKDDHGRVVMYKAYVMRH